MSSSEQVIQTRDATLGLSQPPELDTGTVEFLTYYIAAYHETASKYLAARNNFSTHVPALTAGQHLRELNLKHLTPFQMKQFGIEVPDGNPQAAVVTREQYAFILSMFTLDMDPHVPEAQEAYRQFCEDLEGARQVQGTEVEEDQFDMLPEDWKAAGKLQSMNGNNSTQPQEEILIEPAHEVNQTPQPELNRDRKLEYSIFRREIERHLHTNGEGIEQVLREIIGEMTSVNPRIAALSSWSRVKENGCIRLNTTIKQLFRDALNRRR